MPEIPMDKFNSEKWLAWVAEIQAVAQSGLAYTTNEFDKLRFMRLREIAAEISADCSGESKEEMSKIFSVEKGYATPKIEVRTFILQEEKILLVKERADDLWSLPGGWADVHESPAAMAVKEAREETGYEVSVKKLLALWDRRKHDHPPQWPHIWKCIFHCELVSGEFQPNIEISAMDFFSLENLPPLSIARITANQLIRLYEMVLNPKDTEFD